MKFKILTAIFISGKNTQDPKWFKYRNINGSQAGKNRFIEFAKTKQADEVNFYDKKTGLFLEKIILADR